MKAWLEHVAGADNDVLLVRGELRRLSAMVAETGTGVLTRVDLMQATFVAR